MEAIGNDKTINKQLDIINPWIRTNYNKKWNMNNYGFRENTMLTK
jgi:hypothetical protein